MIRTSGTPSHYRNLGRRREKEAKSLFKEIIAENFIRLKKETDIQIHESQKVPNKMNLKRPKQRYIIIKLTKFKNERIIKAAIKNNFFFKKRFYLFIFRERGREGEREGERR